MVKQYLQIKGESYDEINIDLSPEVRDELRKISGQARVPVTIVEKQGGKRAMSIGYNLGTLASAIN